VAIVSLCLLAQAYDHASDVVQTLGEFDSDVELLVQVDHLVQLLETPVFTGLRLQLLEPARHVSLLRTLYGLLMLLPQTSAFHTLQARLQCVTALTLLNQNAAGKGADGVGGSALLAKAIDLKASLEQFRSLQRRRQSLQEGYSA
jgi:vacuole morphology and inheritance protein 14